jgi:hypothetical protein
MRKKHPEIYFQCMVKLALVQSAELGRPTPFERQYTPEEVIARLEQRVGPEGRQLFEDFLRKVKRLERGPQGAGSDIRGHRYARHQGTADRYCAPRV